MKSGLKVTFTQFIAMLFFCMGISCLSKDIAYAHQEQMDSVIIVDAKLALDKGDVTPALKWVNKENEGELKIAFNSTLAERVKGKAVQEAADMDFLNTIVRLYHVREGTTFTALMPAGTETNPAVIASRKALSIDSSEELLNLIANDVASGVRKRFAAMMETKKHADESVEAGREFVSAYMELVHYAERLHLDATAQMTHPK
jgi:Family of unknown function (DUF6448)